MTRKYVWWCRREHLPLRAKRRAFCFTKTGDSLPIESNSPVCLWFSAPFCEVVREIRAPPIMLFFMIALFCISIKTGENIVTDPMRIQSLTACVKNKKQIAASDAETAQFLYNISNELSLYIQLPRPVRASFSGERQKTKNRNEFLQNRNGFARLKLMSISPHVGRGKHRLLCKRDISPRGQNMRSAGTTWPGKQKLRTLLECGAGRLYAITIVWLQNRSHSLNVWRKQWRSHGHHRLRQVLSLDWLTERDFVPQDWTVPVARSEFATYSNKNGEPLPIGSNSPFLFAIL